MMLHVPQTFNPYMARCFGSLLKVENDIYSQQPTTARGPQDSTMAPLHKRYYSPQCLISLLRGSVGKVISEAILCLRLGGLFFDGWRLYGNKKVRLTEEILY